jgi:parallel beta-helix repeat protein
MQKTTGGRFFMISLIGLVLLIAALFGSSIFSVNSLAINKTSSFVGTSTQTQYKISIAITPTEITKTNSATAAQSITDNQPKTIYVAPEGNNLADGSLDHPWKTIQYAVDRAKPGTTIFLRGGLYSESIHITNAGKEGKPIQLSAYNDESVTIDGGQLITITGDAEYWIINRLNLQSSADRIIRLNSNNWIIRSNHILGAVYLWGNHNTLDDNEIDGSRHTGNENGLMEDGPYSFNNVIKNNNIHDFYDRGIWSQWFTHESLFEHNTVYNITGKAGICIDLDGATSFVDHQIIRTNTVHDCSQTGIELENAYYTLVENNLVYHTGLEGIQIISYDGCQPGENNDQMEVIKVDCRGDNLNVIVQQNIIFDGGTVGGIVSYESSGVKVYNNTVNGGESVALYINASTEFSKNWDVRGNIFSNHDRAEISLIDPASLSFDDNNLVYPKKSRSVYEVRGNHPDYFSLNQWREKFKLGLSSINGNPRYVNLLENDFHLQVGSPAIDAGVDVGIKADFDGISRPQLAGPDCGVYEYVAPN